MDGNGVARWYAVRCKSRQETIAQENLLRQGFGVYLPRIQVKRRRQGRWIQAVEALFPGYIFIRLDRTRRCMSTVRSTRGVIGLVRFGEQPATIADPVIDALLEREDPTSGLHFENRSSFSAGEMIRVMDGPLAGIEGVFTHQDGDKRVIVLLELLGRANEVTLSRDWVARAA